MTRERAIRILKGDTLYNSRELKKAKEMAIRALEVDEAYQLEYEKTCDRNICTQNEYNGIGCNECEVSEHHRDICRDTKCISKE